MRVAFPEEPEAFADFRQACEAYVLPGYLPEKPIFTNKSRVVSAGSCFAEALSRSLSQVGIPNTHLAYTEATNSAVASASLIANSLAGFHGEAGDILRAADVLVLTLGVGFGAFVGSDPVYQFTRDIVKKMVWRQLSPDEVRDSLISLAANLRHENPDIEIIVTLSPLPLTSALLQPSVVGADCLSKSILRVGIEAAVTHPESKIRYWPSFEMVRGLAPHRERVFGVDGADNRHISEALTQQIMRLFIEKYFALT